MRLHFPSVCVGIAGLSVIFISMSQGTTAVGPPRIEYGPHPRDMVQVKEGTPLVVPADRVFVLTGLGNLSNYSAVSVRVNGLLEIVSDVVPAGITQQPVGFTVQAGSTFEVFDADNSDLEARAWGYMSKY